MVLSNSRAIQTYTSPGVSYCVSCGKWPACLYVDYNDKNGSGRICEACAKGKKRKNGRIVLKAAKA